MARSVQDAKLDSRNARDKLKPRSRPYYTTLIPGELHIGYRRRRKGKGAQGRWLVRRYMGKAAQGVGRYLEKDIGLADDHLDADGKTILDFKQAQKLANEWRRDDDGEPSPGGRSSMPTPLSGERRQGPSPDRTALWTKTWLTE